MDKKELKEAYKQFKPEMGIFIYKCIPTEKVYLGYSQNLKADINGTTFQLKLGSFTKNKNLQNDWKKYSESAFEITIIEKLDYDKDESKKDYTEDLVALRELCSAQFSNFEFIQK